MTDRSTTDHLLARRVGTPRPGTADPAHGLTPTAVAHPATDAGVGAESGIGAGASVPQPNRRRVLARAVAALLVAYAVLTGLWVLAGLLIVHGPLGALRSYDDRVAREMVGRRTPRLDDIAYVVAHGADTWIKIGATALLAVAFWLAWRRFHEVAVVAVSLILEASVFITVTTIVQRPRPSVPQLEASPVSSSFPSGHTAAAAVYAALAVIVFWHTRSTLWRALAVVLSALAPIAIGLARVYQGMHHVSDVTAGALLGFVTVAVVAVIIGRPDDATGRRDGRRGATAAHTP